MRGLLLAHAGSRSSRVGFGDAGRERSATHTKGGPSQSAIAGGRDTCAVTLGSGSDPFAPTPTSPGFRHRHRQRALIRLGSGRRLFGPVRRPSKIPRRAPWAEVGVDSGWLGGARLPRRSIPTVRRPGAPLDGCVSAPAGDRITDPRIGGLVSSRYIGGRRGGFRDTRRSPPRHLGWRYSLIFREALEVPSMNSGPRRA